MKVTINVDGACEPVNPGGIGSYGFVVRDLDGNVLKEGMGVIGEGEGITNNVAEYTSAIEALGWIGENMSPESVKLRGDSELLIKQVKGEYRVKSDRIKPLYKELKEAIGSLDCGFESEWVPREKNEGADSLSKDAVDEYLDDHDYEHGGRPLVRCDECGAWMVVRDGEYGEFYGCSRYPDCKNTKPLESADKSD